VRILAAVVIAAAMFGVPRTAHEARCFLHCHGEPETEITAIGWPAAYWSHDVLPGDPPRVSPARMDPAALVLDVIVLGLLLCAFAIVSSAVRRPTRLHIDRLASGASAIRT
jgi:hypothetical protein